MNKDKQDVHLQTPQDANTEKHINFKEIEDAGDSPLPPESSKEDEDSPTKKAWEQLREEQKNDATHSKEEA